VGKTEEGKTVKIPVANATIEGNLSMPPAAKGVVLFAHGSGSSRFSPRNQYVAKVLNKAGFATLLIDLLTTEEEEIDIRTGQFRFDIDLLAHRLIDATIWLRKNLATRDSAFGYFGASAGAAAALIAAAELPAEIKAVVSRGGRPDLALDYLQKVRAPTLLIVGGNDSVVIDLNKKALARLSVVKKLEIVPGASHLFEEQGKLGEVAKLSVDWFLLHLS
jgi:putative phosphoribosyl transferase